MESRIKVGALVMADNADIGEEPIFVFGYISDIQPEPTRTYYAVDWFASSNDDEANLGVTSDYEKDNIEVYLEIYDDWANGRYDKNKKYGKEIF